MLLGLFYLQMASKHVVLSHPYPRVQGVWWPRYLVRHTIRHDLLGIRFGTRTSWAEPVTLRSRLWV